MPNHRTRPSARWVASTTGLIFLCACGGAADDEISDQGDAVTAGDSFSETTARAFPQQPCGPGKAEGCSTNYVVVADLNGDGNLDVVFANGGGHFEPGAAEPSVVYFGDGKGAFTDGAKAFSTPIAPSRVRQIAVGDIDGNGTLDLYMPGGFGLDDDQLFVRKGAKFENEASTRLPKNARRSRAGGAHLGDIDNDGDLNLVVIDWGTQPNPDAPGVSAVKVNVLLNDGKGVFTPGETLPAPEGSSATDVDLQDVNGDFDLDLIVTNRNGQSRLYLNQGGGKFKDVTKEKAFPPKRGEFSFNVEACDVNGDGHLDLLYDGAASRMKGHDTQILMNDGTGAFVDATDKRISGEETTDDNQVKCADVDNDGDFDLVVASLAGRSEKLFLNDGAGMFAAAKGKMPAIVDPTLGIDFGDFDGDGRVDFVTAQGEDPSRPFLNRVYMNGLKGKADTLPPVFRRVEAPAAVAGKPTVLRFAVSDSHTSETGQHVKDVTVSWKAGTKSGTVPARFVGGDIFRAVIPAQEAGTISAAPTATDRRGNKATGSAVKIVVGNP